MVAFSVLSEADRDLVHEKSLEILSRAGIRVESEKVLRRMKEAGCDVDHADARIRFPRELVEGCAARAPSRFTLGSLDGKHDLHLGEGRSYVTTDGQGCYTADFETGEQRDSTMQDLINASKVADGLEYIDCFWPMVTAGDMPDGSRSLHELVQHFRVSGKHFTTDCFNETQARYYRQLLGAILGGDEHIAARNIASMCCCPVTPLQFEAPMLEGTVALGDVGVPVLILPMPISGTTSPMSMLATIIQNNAEVLAGNAIFQTFHPGRPVIYGSAPGVLDMSTSLFCVGSPEGALQNAACVQMSKRYGMPSLASGGGADAQAPGIQSAAERITGMLPTFLAGADLVCGVGLTGTAQCLHLEELVIGEDLANYCRRVAQGVQTEERHALTDLVVEVGPGGDFLAEESTVEYLHSGEHYMPKVFCREGYATWKTSPKRDIVAYGKERARRLLEEHNTRYLDSTLMEELEKILAQADAAFPQ